MTEEREWKWGIFSTEGVIAHRIVCGDIYDPVEVALIPASQECNYNAALIAAAPELLEALKQCVFALDSAVMLQGLKELAPFAEQARELIEEVEGE